MIYLWSLAGPFVLVLILRLLPLGILLEEVFKGVLVMWLAKSDRRASLLAAMGIGLAYGFSELVLFSLTYWPAGVYLASLWRLLLTIPMHGVTTMLWLLGARKGKVWLGAAAAVAVHLLFNLLMRSPLYF